MTPPSTRHTVTSHKRPRSREGTSVGAISMRRVAGHGAKRFRITSDHVSKIETLDVDLAQCSSLEVRIPSRSYSPDAMGRKCGDVANRSMFWRFCRHENSTEEQRARCVHTITSYFESSTEELQTNGIPRGRGKLGS